MPLEADDYFTFLLKGLQPQCTHAMLLAKESKNKKHPIFLFDLDMMKGKRRLIEAFFRLHLSWHSVEDKSYWLQIIQADGLATSTADSEYGMRIKYPIEPLNASLLMDMVLTSGVAEASYKFTFIPSEPAAYIFFHEDSSNRSVHPFFRIFLFGSMAAGEIFLKTDFAENFDVFQVMKKVDSGQSSVIFAENPDFANDSPSLPIFLEFALGMHWRRLLYVYLSLISGPFFKYMSSMSITFDEDKVLHIDLMIGEKHRDPVLKFFDRISIVMKGETYMTINYFGQQEESLQQSFDTKIAKMITERLAKMELDTKRFPCSKPDYSENGLIAALIDYGMVKCSLERDNRDILGNRDRQKLGLPRKKSAGRDSYLRKAKRRLRLLSADDEPVDRIDISSEDETFEVSGQNLQDLFLLKSRQVIQRKIERDIVGKELEEIKSQCRDCQMLIMKQRKLIIYELYLQIKGMLTKYVPNGSHLLRELDKKDSVVAQRLSRIQIPGVPSVAKMVSRAMQTLQSERLSVAKPSYNGEYLYSIASIDLRSSFIKLLPLYQPSAPSVPEDIKLPDYELGPIPENVTMENIVTIDNQLAELEGHLASALSELSQAQKESTECRKVYKHHEILIVGTVFQSFVDDLRKLTPNGDILEAAEVSESPVSIKMKSMGIESVGVLRKILYFVITYRNDIAHPKVEDLPEDKITARLGSKLFSDFKVLHENFEMIQRLLQ